METKGNKKIILTNKLEVDIIELPKIKGKEKEQDELLDWLYFLENPKGERVTKNMEENEELKEAVEKLDNLSEDEKMQKIAELREKAIMDEKAIYDKGLDVGEKLGRQEGERLGIEKGEKLGIEKGKNEQKIEIAKKMLKKNMPTDIISEITGLTKEEIKNLTT